MMEQIKLEKNIQVMCIQASSFPQGVLEAHQQLHRQFEHKEDRQFVGISYRDANQQIIYKAGVEMLQDEKLLPGTEAFEIRKGIYLSEFLSNFRADVQVIGKTFTEMLKHPELDPNGYCLEYYVGEDDVRCMVPLDVRS